ncbi:MAG: hypothetical protein JO218_09940 [Burkholderiales bacterium]|nr:hypothetical protein [Burkholderiales bacterium]
MTQAAPTTTPVTASTTPATRYCTSCQRTRPEAGGKVYVTGKRMTKLWRCAQCLARRQPGANKAA